MKMEGLRKDWDYVEFADYAADMKESSDRAVAAIAGIKRREDGVRLQLAVTQLALADALQQLGPRSRAKVSVNEFACIDELPKTALEMSRELSTDSWEFRLAKTKTQA